MSSVNDRLCIHKKTSLSALLVLCFTRFDQISFLPFVMAFISVYQEDWVAVFVLDFSCFPLTEKVHRNILSTCLMRSYQGSNLTAAGVVQQRAFHDKMTCNSV